jgi:hypothetical protein
MFWAACKASAPGEAMARYKSYDYAQMVMIPVSLEKQLMPGTLEFAIHEGPPGGL